MTVSSTTNENKWEQVKWSNFRSQMKQKANLFTEGFYSIFYAIYNCYIFSNIDTVKPLNSWDLRVLKYLSVIKRCPLFWGSLTKIVTFGNKYLARNSKHVRYLGWPLLGGFTVIYKSGNWWHILSIAISFVEVVKLH